MVDFNTKKNILQKLRKKRGENKLLWLPCVIAAAFVKLWYGTVCRIGMALSDRNGNFLGIKTPEKKPKSRRQDDIVYVKKPFIGRIMSAVLAAAFVLMVAPELDIDFGITASAAFETTVKVVENGVEVPYRIAPDVPSDDNTHLIKDSDYQTAREYTIEDGSVKCETSGTGIHVSWSYGNTPPSTIRYGVRVLITEVGTGGVIKDETFANQPNRTEITYSGNEYAGKNVKVAIYLIVNLDQIVVKGDLADGATFDPSGSDSAMVVATNEKYHFTSERSIDSAESYINAKIAAPSTLKIMDRDGSGIYSEIYKTHDNNAYIVWSPVNQEGGTDAGEPATGYVIWRKKDNEAWVQRDTVLTTALENNKTNDGNYQFYDDEMESGCLYQYFVESYRVIWGGGTDYKENDTSVITSGNNPNGGQKILYTAPDTPAITARQSISASGSAYYEITVTNNGSNNNYDGIRLFRTEGKLLTDADIPAGSGYDTFAEWAIDTVKGDTAQYGNLIEIESAFVNRNTYSDTNIIEGKTYYYYAIAYKNISGSGSVAKGILFDKSYSTTNTTFTLDSFKKIVPVISRVASTDGQVAITWEPVNGAERYELQARQTGIHDETNKTVDYSGEWETIYEGGNTSYEHRDLYNSDRYEYRVRAIVDMKTVGENNAVEDYITTQWSKTARATVGTLLDTPMNVRAATADGQVTVSWDAVAGATGYDLHYSSDGDSGVIGGLRSLTYTHTNIPNDKVYTYWVVAYKEIAIGGDPQNPQKVTSNESNRVKIKVGIGLAIPQDMRATTVDGQITITWSAVNGAQGYVLHYKNKNSGEGEKTVDLSRTSFNHIGLKNGDVYEYWVEAYKEVSGERVYSDPSVTISQMVGAVLDAPKDFMVTTTDGSVNLSWSAVNGAEGYIIHASSGGRYYQFDVSKLTYVHSDLNNGEIWTYYVTAYKTVNGSRTYSNPSESKSVTIGISLNSAVDLTATAGNRQIDLSWTAVNGAEGYVVYLYNSKTMEFEPITVTSKTTYSHVGLKNGRQYTYMVAPYKNINGKRFYGDYSMSVTAIPTTGSITDMDHELIVKGTAPYGISHGEYITAVSNHGAFDESVDVYFTTSRESTQAVRDVLRNYADGLSSFIIYPFDISIYRENTHIEVDPEDGYTVTVTMPVPDRLIAYRDYITVVHIGDVPDDTEQIALAEDWYNNYDRQLEILPCAIVDVDNVWCVQFKCSSFSPYAFVIYKEHIQDVASGGGLMDTGFSDTFNSGLLLFTALPDILPNNRKLKIVQSGSKRYHIKNVTKK